MFKFFKSAAKSAAKTVPFVGLLGAFTYYSVVEDEKQRSELQKKNQGATIKSEFVYLPGVGGYTKHVVQKPKEQSVPRSTL